MLAVSAAMHPAQVYFVVAKIKPQSQIKLTTDFVTPEGLLLIQAAAKLNVVQTLS